MDDDWIPQPGDLVWADLDPTAGSEQAGRRPVLVVSIDSFNATTNRIVVLPTSSRIRGWATEVPFHANDRLNGVVLCDQVRTIDWRTRFAKRAGQVNEAVLTDARLKLSIILGIE